MKTLHIERRLCDLLSKKTSLEKDPSTEIRLT